MEAEMNTDQGLILALYAGVAGLILLAGFAYKEFRDYRKRKREPKFNFPPQKPDVPKDVHEQDRLAVTR
jgi:hypothetical protein